MLSEKLPKGLQFESVQIIDSSGKTSPGRAAVKAWTQKESFIRGFKKSAKIIGVFFLLIIPFGFMEPFAFMVWGSLAALCAFVVLGPFFHMLYWSEKISFFYVEGKCPSCEKKGKLTSYLSTAFESEFTVLCPECGQTSTVKAPSTRK